MLFGMSTQEDSAGAVREVDEAAPARRRFSLRNVAAAGVANAGFVGGFAFLLPRIANYHDVWEVMSNLSTGELAALALAPVINLATYAPPWMAALPGLGYWQATVLTQTST